MINDDTCRTFEWFDLIDRVHDERIRLERVRKMKYTLFHETGDHNVRTGDFLTITATTVEAALQQIAANKGQAFANECIITKAEREVA